VANPESNVAIVFVDADNTLWDTDRVFAAAQMKLLASAELVVGITASTEDRLGFVRLLDQGIAERHHSGLRYPPTLLARAVALALKGVPPERAARLAWTAPETEQSITSDAAAHLAQEFISSLKSLPSLRPGVREGLLELRHYRRKLLVITEGGRDRVLRIAGSHHLTDYFDRVIDAPKSSRLYTRALRLLGRPKMAFMVGDQLNRDILPAKQAGLTTVYFPGGFRPKWEPETQTIRPDFQIDSFAEVPLIITRTLTDAAVK
jgi:putative hydrolase of the HAD superfamily